MTFLLDVNVLIALLDRAHVHHAIAHEWFAAAGHKGFATCPLTQNGLLRILGNPRYPKSPGTPSAIVPLLASLTGQGGHVFWPDDVSLLDPMRVEAANLLDWAQLTDVYLLALAAAHGGKLATLDRKILARAVSGGADALHVIA